MKQYIDKDALVAEIESIVNETNYKPFTDEVLGKRKACEDIKDFLNTLEVKEVDLEAEYDNYTKHILACDVQFKPFTHLYNCAKYFFELGLKAKGE